MKGHFPKNTYRLPWQLSDKKIRLQCRRCRRCGFDPWVRKIPWNRKWQPTPAFLLGESQGQRSLAGYSPRACKESDTTEHAHHTEILCSHSGRHCEDRRKNIVYTLEQPGSVLLSDSSALLLYICVMWWYTASLSCVCCVCVCSALTCKLFMHHLLL